MPDPTGSARCCLYLGGDGVITGSGREQGEHPSTAWKLSDPMRCLRLPIYRLAASSGRLHAITAWANRLQWRRSGIEHLLDAFHVDVQLAVAIRIVLAQQNEYEV